MGWRVVSVRESSDERAVPAPFFEVVVADQFGNRIEYGIGQSGSGMWVGLSHNWVGGGRFQDGVDDAVFAETVLPVLQPLFDSHIDDA